MKNSKQRLQATARKMAKQNDFSKVEYLKATKKETPYRKDAKDFWTGTRRHAEVRKKRA